MTSYRVNHTTRYRYREPVSLCHNEARLLPCSLPHQLCLHSQLQIQPLPTVYHEREDFFGNRVTYFAVQEPHTLLEVTALSEVQIVPRDIPYLGSALAWQEAGTLLRRKLDPDVLEIRQFLLDSPLVSTSQVLADYAKPSFSSGRTLLEAAHDLMQRIHWEFTYDPEFTTIATPLSEVFEHRRGVCQDFAHLAIGCLRSLGLAARYISGYVETLPPLGQSRLVGTAASHAWVSVYSPGQGWVDFDPTNDQIPTDRHITVAWGRDYSDVTPLKGTILGGSEHVLQVAVEVCRREDADQPQQG